MNEEEKKSATKSKKLAETFGEIMNHLKLTPNDRCSVIMNLLCAYLVERKIDPEEFLKWISEAVPLVIKDWGKMGFGHITRTSGNTKVEIIDKEHK